MWLKTSFKLVLNPLLASTLLTTAASCSKTPETSKPLVTDVKHSAVKNQSIGNCWLYAAAGWAESLHYTATGEQVDISESYWTWWHFYDQLTTNTSIKEISTGGWFHSANNLIQKRGFLYEGEFISEEANQITSARQKQAVAYINQQLKEGGTLATQELRTKDNVRAELDKAFGSDMTASESIARKAEDFVVGYKTNGQVVNLSEITTSQTMWKSTEYPQLHGVDAQVSEAVTASRKAILKRVMKALNDHQPVLMTFQIDFKAWNKTTGFIDLPFVNPEGKQGGHMVVLEDYVVDNVPGVGSIEEGEVSDELKSKALLGDVRYFVAKNSWSTNVSDGYHRPTMKYLNTNEIGWQRASGEIVFHTALTDFILPPGY
jgi:hypothetical protein